MNAPLFSVAIPTFNRSDLVTHAIQSVLAQTFDNFEIIVCDNFSTDDTAEAIGRFTDPRVQYKRTPSHLVIADNWEFARSKAIGKFILMLGDDDALVGSALERFAQDIKRYDADFLFCRTSEYRDRGYPGPEKNTLDCPSFSGLSRSIQAGEFLQPLFSFRPAFDMHPSAFIFSRSLADMIAGQCGRFFQTNGVEYCAWPLAAVFARQIVYVDLPISICGRTGKSWGSNLVFCNPGKKRISQFISDVEQEQKCAPLTNFAFCNLMAEGMLTAKRIFPNEFSGYEFDEPQYLRSTLIELRKRTVLGVDVSREIDELMRYVNKYPSLKEELMLKEQASEKLSMASRKNFLRRIRATIGDLGIRRLRDRARARQEANLRAHQDAEKVKRGEVKSGFRISGSDFGFSDIVGCAEFLERMISADSKNAHARRSQNSCASVSAGPVEIGHSDRLPANSVSTSL